jgi:L-fucose mutarotase/ribose pyranase (RbsD/FucU family)
MEKAKLNHSISVSRCIRLLALAGVVALSCIQRNNPFDPINYHPFKKVVISPDSLRQIRLNALSPIDLRLRAIAIEPALDSILATLTADSITNAQIAISNAARRRQNDSIVGVNLAIGKINDTTTIEALLLEKQTLDSLRRLVVGDTARQISLRSRRQFIIHERDYARWYSDSVNAAFLYNPAIVIDSIFSRFFVDSIADLFTMAAVRCDSLDSLVGRFYRAMVQNNSAVIQPYNMMVVAQNSEIRGYNQIIQFRRKSANAPVIADRDSLVSVCENAAAGDIIVLAGDTFSDVSIRFSNSGMPNKWIVIMGQPDMSTVLFSPDLIFSNNRYIILSNIVFAGGNAGGAKLEYHSGPITFADCWFVDNKIDGLSIIDSRANIRNCRFLNNNQHGINSSSTKAEQNEVIIENSLFAHNNSYGIRVVATALLLQNVTIADNLKGGIYLSADEMDLRINNSLITGNIGWGIYFESMFNGTAVFSPNLTDLSINTAGDVFGKIDPKLSYWSFDVQYVDPPTNNYDIAPGSYFDQIEKQVPPIVVGYRTPGKK